MFAENNDLIKTVRYVNSQIQHIRCSASHSDPKDGCKIVFLMTV